ncbi:AAA family ATPase, partial [Streptomyces sp. NPDC032472]|uniref:ATP-binding protein n=1 Tax=Streptomyces sp. NPDC032472 TaxID=3155018 RepID=UPI0033FDB493
MGSEFVGRAAELAVLAERFEAAARGSGSVVLLAGPAGIGKSTLAAEALHRHAAPAGFTVVRGHCPRDAVAPPLWPWQRALRLAGAVGAREETGVAAAAGQAWSATVPADAAAVRFLELARMSGALAAAAAERPLAVLLEDLHWADAASLDLLRHLAGEVAESGLLVLGTFREPVPEETAGLLADLGRYGAVTLRLASFTRDEVARCVGEADAAESYRRTGGLPLLVTALGTHSGSLATAVSGLLAGLTAEQREVVRAAAVLGGQLDADRLAAVLPQPGEAAVAQALEAAWHAGVLTAARTTAALTTTTTPATPARSPAAGRTYRFTHDLVRDEVLGRTTPATARALHRAAARALERSGERVEAARIAAHWRQSGPEPEHRAAAAHWSRIAADLAR